MNVPVLVSVPIGELCAVSFYADQESSIRLPAELEGYDPSTGRINVWVKPPCCLKDVQEFPVVYELDKTKPIEAVNFGQAWDDHKSTYRG